MTRRAFLQRAALVAGGACSLLPAACSEWPWPPSTGTRRPVPSPSPGPVAVALALPPEPRMDLLPLLHLTESGFFRERGIQVQHVWGQGPYGALPELLAGRAQLALIDVPTVARTVEQRVEVLGIFQLYGGDPSAVFSLQRSRLDSATALNGRRVGIISPHLAAAFALQATLRGAALLPGAVELVTSGGLFNLLESGQVLAVAGSLHLAPGLGARGLAISYLPRAGWEVVPGPSIVTTRTFASAQRATVKRVVSGLSAGIQMMLANPSGLRATADRVFASTAATRGAVQAQVEAVLVSLRAADESRPGWADAQRYGAAERYLHELGVTAGTAELRKVFVNEWLPEPRGA